MWVEVFISKVQVKSILPGWSKGSINRALNHDGVTYVNNFRFNPGRTLRCDGISSAIYNFSSIKTFEENIFDLPLMCGDQIISVQHGQYHGCWCSGDLHPRDNSTYNIDCVEYTSSCLTWERISTTCVMSVWKNDMNCRYIFMFLLKNLAPK